MSEAVPRVQKGIPLPAPRGMHSRMGIVLRAMEVGDSYLCCSEFEAKNAQSLAHSKGMKIARRRTDEGYRIWRLA